MSHLRFFYVSLTILSGSKLRGYYNDRNLDRHGGSVLVDGSGDTPLMLALKASSAFSVCHVLISRFYVLVMPPFYSLLLPISLLILTNILGLFLYN